MSQETCNALLHGQLQDGLRYKIMKVPAVSGAQSYPELCLASWNEEKRLLELKKRQQYQQANTPRSSRASNSSNAPATNKACDAPSSSDPQKGTDTESRKCYICGKTSHAQRNCRYKSRKQESTPQAKRPADTETGGPGTKANMVRSEGAKTETP